ncbi:MAG: hypothetical protein WCO56_06705 [Verrucomicrobiota bacterium]
MNSEVLRLFHSNGSLRIEIQRRNGRAHGMNREYYPNGQLASEIPYEDGFQNGTAKFWAMDGRFLGEYTLNCGSGLAKKWYDNGVLCAEVTLAKGLPHGRQKTWYEDGKPAPDSYWIKAKKVSRKKYLKACEIDPALPLYPEENDNPI